MSVILKSTTPNLLTETAFFGEHEMMSKLMQYFLL